MAHDLDDLSLSIGGPDIQGIGHEERAVSSNLPTRRREFPMQLRHCIVVGLGKRALTLRNGIGIRCHEGRPVSLGLIPVAGKDGPHST